MDAPAGKLEKTGTRYSGEEPGCTGDLRYELLRSIRQGDRLARPGDDHDGHHRVRIVREPAQAAHPSIGCARIKPIPWEVPLKETGEEGHETDNGDMGAEADLGRTCLVQHLTEIEGAQPVKLRPPPQPPLCQEGSDGLTDPGDAQGGDNRTGCGSLELNGSTGPEEGLLPSVLRRLSQTKRRNARRKLTQTKRRNVTLDALAGARWFRTLNLASRYWQFRVMPFGLCNAPETFQRLMETALRGLTWKTCLVYLNDIIVFRMTEEEHLGRLERELSRLQSLGLKIKLENTDPEKMAAVQKWPMPRCLRESGKRGEAALGAERGERVRPPKARADQPPDPGPPRFRPSFPANASEDAIGAVLSQQEEQGQPVEIAFTSRSLSRAERVSVRQEVHGPHRPQLLKMTAEHSRTREAACPLVGTAGVVLFDVVHRPGREQQNVKWTRTRRYWNSAWARKR
ncbi:Retrovirus-related Pol polyprotein from transposon 17.6 [Trichinella britovi]|uniref:Retrovirus-related Pol polyprotein from transposon 17.6 n=1 Tax=Trichinella britovi TaxID=45882 RepID=A0A0V1D0Q3_TRIBR|nr:Retrovirus-related Pol polyprotein from transposon 17.6 [Trichinella britovi]